MNICRYNRNCISDLAFNQLTEEELYSDSNNEKINTNKNVQDKISDLKNIIIIEKRDDGTMLSDIDPDLNMLYNMTDAIDTSSRYHDGCIF